MKFMDSFKILFMSLSALFLSSCNSDNDSIDNGSGEPLAILKVTETEGISSFAIANICPVLEVTNPLAADEIEFLYAVREDEKLTEDLYLAFSAKYPAYIQFSRIATAEVTHIAAVETLLSYYEIKFPPLAETGVFEDIERQARYDALLAKGSTLQGAFEAIAVLEEDNIVAYKAVEANIINANIKLLVANMIKASSNHLKAAVRQLTVLGVTYIPTTLDQTTFDTIINSAFVQGNKYGQQMGKGNKGGNTNSQKGNQGQGNKGNVNSTGTCTGTASGTAPGTSTGKNQAGKGYRGGR